MRIRNKSFLIGSVFVFLFLFVYVFVVCCLYWADYNLFNGNQLFGNYQISIDTPIAYYGKYSEIFFASAMTPFAADIVRQEAGRICFELVWNGEIIFLQCRVDLLRNPWNSLKGHLSPSHNWSWPQQLLFEIIQLIIV